MQENKPSAEPQKSVNITPKSGFTEIFGGLLLISAILTFLALSSFQAQINKGQEPLAEYNLVGSLGHYSAELLFLMFGKSAFLLGPYFLLLGILTIMRGGFSDPLARLSAILIMIVGSSILGAVLYAKEGLASQVVGGLVGARMGGLLQNLLGKYGSAILSTGILMSGIFLAIRIPMSLFLMHFQALVQRFVKRYAEIFAGGALSYPSSPAFSDPAAPAPQGQSPQNTSAPPPPPWIERVEKTERIEKTSQPEMPVQKQEEPSPQAEQTSPQSTKAFRVSQHTRDIQAMLAQMQQRPSFTSQESADDQIPRDSSEQRGYYFDGYFDPDGSRFHFRRASAVDPRSYLSSQTNSLSSHALDEPSLRDLDSQNLSTLEKPLGRPRERALGIEQTKDQGRLSPVQLQETRSTGRLAFQETEELPALEKEAQDHAQKNRSNPSPYKSDVQDEQSAEPYENSAQSELSSSPYKSGVQDERNAEPYENSAQSELSSSPYKSDVQDEQDAEPYENSAQSELSPSPYQSGVQDEQDAEPYENNTQTKLSPEPCESNAQDELSSNAYEDHEDQESNAQESNVEEDESLAYKSSIKEELHSVSVEKGEVLPSSLVPKLSSSYEDYRLSANFLQRPQSIPQNNIAAEINDTRTALKKVMREYGIQADVVDTQRGPIITLYEIKLEPGIKVSRVLSLQSEICMNLAVPIVRIIAPIPGKPTIGIEIPNRVREPVLFSQLLPVPPSNLRVILGKNIAGENQYAELTQLPHLLIAGATGAGKSVYLNAVIASLLYQASPEDIRFVMIDPKMVELKLYEGIPHLLMPVITDVYDASKALRWLLDEMERRYCILSALRCRDIRAYNQRVKKAESKQEHNTMPYVVVMIDELSDLMMIAAKDVEDSIIRLTQKARAVGIHIIMATQRPSVDVITALIKANCPARVAFQVAQRTDSRTILDASGAENLLGKGDLLYKSPHSTILTRIQAPLLSVEEVEAIVKQARTFAKTAYVDLGLAQNKNAAAQNEEEVDEEVFAQALEIVLESGKTSTSHLQRRMRIGYNKAANLIEMMEERGYLSPIFGNKPREILKRD